MVKFKFKSSGSQFDLYMWQANQRFYDWIVFLMWIKWRITIFLTLNVKDWWTMFQTFNGFRLKQWMVLGFFSEPCCIWRFVWGEWRGNKVFLYLSSSFYYLAGCYFPGWNGIRPISNCKARLHQQSGQTISLLSWYLRRHGTTSKASHKNRKWFFFLGYFIFFLSCSAYCGIRISSQINRWFSEFGLIEYDITLILNIKYEFQWICVSSISLSH